MSAGGCCFPLPFVPGCMVCVSVRGLGWPQQVFTREQPVSLDVDVYPSGASGAIDYFLLLIVRSRWDVDGGDFVGGLFRGVGVDDGFSSCQDELFHVCAVASAAVDGDDDLEWPGGAGGVYFGSMFGEFDQ